MARTPTILPGTQARTIAYDRPAAGQILTFVRDAIVSMELLPGQMVSETALAQQFGVSRTPVREALIQLSAIGFVEVLPQRGTYVSKLSMDKILQARFIREALEVAAVSHLANHLSGDERNHLLGNCNAIIVEQRQAAADKDAKSFQDLDDSFHQTLASSTQYPRLASLIESEKAQMDRVRCLSLYVDGQFERLLNQHQAIINAIAGGSAEKASAAMSAHLQDVFRFLEVIADEHPDYFVP